MTNPVSTLYTADLTGIGKKIADHIARGCHRSATRPLIFFRADDIGVPSRRLEQLIKCFQKHNLPLCLAAVPAWLTETRSQELCRLTGSASSQWCWHQHGRLHRNFERTGKKQEFGPARTASDIRASLSSGRKRLEQLLDADFQPFFTPPWNRCGGDTLQALIDLDFRAVSRSKGAQPEAPFDLPDYQVNVDLHTRKETAPLPAVDNLLMEIEDGITSGLCGIMIHHQRMNGAALELLDVLLGLVKSCRELMPVHFGDLLEGK